MVNSMRLAKVCSQDEADLPALKKRARSTVFPSDDEAEIESIASNHIRKFLLF